MRLSFELEKTASGSRARAATFRTLHGKIQTPIFMPVGTQATVRSQNRHSLARTGAQILLANTYHLLLRPGPEVFKKMGGIHRFMGWDRSVLTDSGGFQVFSLSHARKISEEGARFKSYVDGMEIHLSPEQSIAMQVAIGSDIMMAMDQCIPSTAERAEAEAAMHLTHRWAKRSLAARGDSPQALFGIVQGACFEDLRKTSAAVLTEQPFDGFAIGGLAVGESKAQREDFTELTADLLPRHLPRYLMGVGTPLDLLEAVHRGVDMFDCILPTALAQQGVSFTFDGRVDLKRGAYKFAEEPISRSCACETCGGGYSRGYLHHLIKTKEILGWQLIGEHNLHFYHELMSGMRASILNDTFIQFYKEKRESIARSDEAYPKVYEKPRRQGIKGAKLGKFELVEGKLATSIRETGSGEVMHSVSDPIAEARALYIDQSKLIERLQDEGDPLVVWDVGLGAGTNAMQAVFAAQSAVKPSGPRRGLRLVSFENDLDAFRLALKHLGSFPSLWHEAPKKLLAQGEWKSESPVEIIWTLFEGDFLETLERAPAPDLIFFDPFSRKTDSGLWTRDCFERILTRLDGKDCELYTYSASTAVRAALLSAGFYVAQGAPTGPKSETTVALTLKGVQRARQKGVSLLSASWLDRWRASAAREAAHAGIVEHPQFLS